MTHQLIAITGSIASGKSAVARALGARLRAEGRSAVVIDLDLVYEMLADDPKSDAATWSSARRDPTRGISRDPAFLRAHMDEFQAALRSLPASDLVIDTERAGVEEIAARLARAALERAGTR